MDIFDIYDFQNQIEKVDSFNVYIFQNKVENAIEDGNLKESLKLLGIVYFNGSLEKSNENKIIFEFSKSRTMAVEILLVEKKIRFWDWMNGYQKGDYFWKYVFKNYPKLGHKILDLLIAEYFSPTDVISCEVVSSVNSDVLCHWLEGAGKQ